jgi:hypothetical protein
MKVLNECPVCGANQVFFPGADEEYEVGDSDYCTNCRLEVTIDWDGEEGKAERFLFWYR